MKPNLRDGLDSGHLHLKTRTLASKPSRKQIKTPEFFREVYKGNVRYIEHGDPFVPWHCHDEYELHMVVATSGNMFVGTYTGEFSSGSLVLIGPRLPHNWISKGVAEGDTGIKHVLVKFLGKPLETMAKNIYELNEIMPLLDRAACGIEFFGLSSEAKAHFIRIRETKGLERFAELLQFLGKLARAQDYRQLSNEQTPLLDGDVDPTKMGVIIDYILDNHHQPLSAELLAQQAGMSLAKFSRVFQKVTGSTFIDFVNTRRITRACELLMNTDKYVVNICFDVGFNNLAYFNRRFLQLKGMTPTEYRNRANGRLGHQSIEFRHPLSEHLVPAH